MFFYQVEWSRRYFLFIYLVLGRGDIKEILGSSSQGVTCKACLFICVYIEKKNTRFMKKNHYLWNGLKESQAFN